MADIPKIDLSLYARELGTVVAFDAGQTLFHEGEAPNFIYFVLKGHVDVSVRGRVVETIGEGQAVGLLSFIDSKSRTVTAVASQPCELALIDHEKFRYMVESLPGFVWYVLGELASRLRQAYGAI